jgi:molecular chaperone DnaJ
METESCRTCAGVGTMPRTEVVTVTIPAGVEPGARISVPGRGHAGARGGPSGDLYISVEVAEHRHFRRHGRDVYVTLPIAVHEAALGARVEVPTLEGPVRLRIPPGRRRVSGFACSEEGLVSRMQTPPSGVTLSSRFRSFCPRTWMSRPRIS